MIPFQNLPLSGQSDDASTLIAPQALELGLPGPTLTPPRVPFTSPLQ
jgi:hypothetical protein